MRKQSLDFLRDLMNTPTPSGFEAKGQRLWCDYTRPFADKVTTDSYGNAAAVLNPRGKPVIMLDGHIDEIGLMVKHIDDKGFVYFQTIGFVSPAMLPAQRVTIHTAGGPVLGVIGATPPHQAHDKAKEKDKKELAVHDLWIEIGAADGKAARKRVSVGDPITLAGEFAMLSEDIAVARAFDDEAGTWVAAEALRLAAASRSKLNCCIVACSTVQEEYGLRGAMMNVFNIRPDAALVIEAGIATDSPGLEESKWGRLEVGKGPVIMHGRENHPALVDLLIRAGKQKKIKLQEAACFFQADGTNASAIFTAVGGVPAALVSVVARYIHSPVEVLSLKDLQQTAELTAAVCLNIKKDETFRVEV